MTGNSSFYGRVDGLKTKVPDAFSQTVLEGAQHALQDTKNPLRITFFATSMRMLFEHLMDTLASHDDVQTCAWFQPASDTAKPTRRQRITYAIQGGLTDTFVTQKLDVDPEPLKGALTRAVDALSKHVHGRQNTVITDPAEQDRFVAATLRDMEAFLDAIRDCREAVLDPIAEELDGAAVQALLCETILAIDELATHHAIEEIYVAEIRVNDIDAHAVTYRATGSISVVLQWGSNSDMRRGDGAELPQDFPFWCDISTPIAAPWDLWFAEVNYGVDTRQWHSNRYDE
ncbi:hypothetical protein [Rhodovibrio salinarum]|uniref:Uncharacterized protein n=1 Tax=Rhodovibrio salinarum TaxID=1087 RepID=A0A934QFD7_9PROT|nr:hypothetical protein [Rhodovibrio salinarum]MBK1695657.1 hypothetical protein [Rhodovibrio salinarum]